MAMTWRRRRLVRAGARAHGCAPLRIWLGRLVRAGAGAHGCAPLRIWLGRLVRAGAGGYTSAVMTSLNDELAELPLFPLNLVLFPGMPLPLHIFEERYKAMIGDCMRQNAPFGVSLIRSGQEVGGPAEPHRIGTTARVLRSELLEQGRMNIITKGERRYEIIEITQMEPHAAALVRLLDEPVGEGFTGITPELTEEYTRLIRGLMTLSGGYTAQVSVPENPVELSYMIAANLDAPTPVRQELLEAPSAADRLNRLIPLLKRRNHALQEEIARQNPFRGPRLN